MIDYDQVANDSKVLLYVERHLNGDVKTLGAVVRCCCTAPRCDASANDNVGGMCCVVALQVEPYNVDSLLYLEMVSAL